VSRLLGDEPTLGPAGRGLVLTATGVLLVLPLLLLLTT
jgi:hypothetical protein